MQNKKLLWMMFGLSCLATMILVSIGRYFDTVVTLIHTPVRKFVSTLNSDFYGEPLPLQYQQVYKIPEQHSLLQNNLSKQTLYDLEEQVQPIPEPNVDPIKDSNGKPVHHIAFIKAHKAASTTVQNIFLRYGYENDLVFALPRAGSTISTANTVRPGSILPPPPSRPYDILCSHVRFDREAFGRILPNDTKYIGIVREPFHQFQSNLQYYRQRFVLNIPGDKPVQEYLLHNDKYMKFGGNNIPSTYNKMAYDFGFPQDLFWSKDHDKIQRFLAKLDNEIDLVIVTEYFDESIVLMRRLLNWDLQYVLYGKLNSKKKKDPRLEIGSEEEGLYRKWAHLDYALYNFFLDKLKEKLKHQPPDFYEELAYFRSTRTKYDDFCKLSLDGGQSVILFEGSKWNTPFIVTKEQCKHLYIREIPFFNQLRARRILQLDRMN
ncbi:galactose-3-O-sulfotransferase 3-like [Mizuhopecten yessoensis]|uniref:Galactose-3-O-sulfotransferase 3 n=1 Tax=Mizuhopecten yessoensis TaxID=6573 RepID=A0A210Q842_MIZYE|nr:galactose-3-O-sulfotransferase 3-like [Mizuhopecten yessoensis]OWF44917.1 Galactose-3-O-sulfotransferase 3 [Mizuhopecten yessoensis]